jgi:hypothetical protein
MVRVAVSAKDQEDTKSWEQVGKRMGFVFCGPRLLTRIHVFDVSFC